MLYIDSLYHQRHSEYEAIVYLSFDRQLDPTIDQWKYMQEYSGLVIDGKYHSSIEIREIQAV